MSLVSANAFATGTSAAQFLKMGAGARAQAMGEAFSAVADDVTAGYWNPAGLAQLGTPEIAAMQNTHFVDTQYQYLAGALPSGKNAFGLSLYRLDHGSIDGYDKQDQKTGSFNAGSTAGSFSIARTINDDLRIGASAKYVSETIDTEKATAFALDIGGLMRWNGFNFSAVIQNIGPAMRMVKDSSPLPLTMRAGASTRWLQEKLLVAVEVSKPNDANVSLHAGAEYKVTSLLAVRGGYSVTPGQSADLGGLTGLNAGLGMQLKRFNLDYSIAPFGDLGLSHKFSLGYKFGEAK